MFHFSSALWVLICFYTFSQASENHPSYSLSKSTFILGVGEQRLVSFPGLKKYSLGGKNIRVLPLPKKFISQNYYKNNSNRNWAENEVLLIKAIQPGITDLWVWKSDGKNEHRTIRVEKNGSHKSSILEKTLSQLNETEVIWTGKGAILRGEIFTLQELYQVVALTQSFPQEIFDETELSESLSSIGANKIKKWIFQSPYKSKLHFEKINRDLWVRGSVKSPQEKDFIEKKIQTFFPKIYFEIDTLPDASPTVYFRVFLLELHKNYFKNLGLQWPSIIENAFHVTTSAITNFLQMNLALQQIEGRGQGKILSNPELVVRAPGEAELFAGGEVPIQVQNRFFSDVKWKKYGLTLKLKVSHIAGDRVRLDILTEVSHLKKVSRSDQLPSIGSNRMNTQVDAQFGKPLFLSGLLQQEMHESAEGLPFLSQIPILGKLFGSEDYQNRRSELVAILYPLARPPMEMTQSTLQKISPLFPKGHLPLPRNWLDSETENQLRSSSDYPWNALE